MNTERIEAKKSVERGKMLSETLRDDCLLTYSQTVKALTARLEELERDRVRLVKAIKPLEELLRNRPDGDIGWRGNKGAKCGWITVSDILLVEQAIDAAAMEATK